MADSGFDAAVAHLKQLARAKRGRPPVRKVIAYLAGDGHAAFVRQNIVAAHCVRRFPAAYVVAVFRDDWGARGFLTDCNPAFHSEMRAAADAPMTMPLDWFDIGTGAPVQCPDETWKARKLNEPDLFLVPGTLGLDPGRVAGLAEAPPALCLPPSQLAALQAAAPRVGLAPDRAHVCVGLEGLGAEARRALVAVLEGADARLVALDRAAAALPGALDLSRLPRNAYPLRVLALARARCVLATAADDLALASAFRVPAAALDRAAGLANLWNAGDLIPAAGPLPPDRLAAMAGDLLARTADCAGWRPDPAMADMAPAEGLALPLAQTEASLVTTWS
ncbi:MAG: hypothetical protein H6907_18085 [Hyphomicrobiales bacterium]|nr:hypothetical protein [Hyphomicrobiales bacterium]MCP5373644.1 hypothetical protein [Hyphomicrobiales bacterium]